MVLKNDKATYTVAHLINGKLVRVQHETFAAAAGCADALKGIRFIDVEFYAEGPNGTKTSSISGSLYVYGRNGVRRACNPYLIMQVTKRNGR